MRQYIVENITDKIYFCPSCHRVIQIPFKGNIKVQSGINLSCGNCQQGKVKIVIKQGENSVNG